MSTLYFPTLPGLAWDVKMTPMASTRVSKHVSGRSVRYPLYARARYQFDLTYSVLSASSAASGAGAASLQTLEGFFLARQGQYDSFLLNLSNLTQDPADSTVTAGLIGTGDGTTTQFPFLRPVGASFTEQVYWAASCSAVYLNGTPLSMSGHWSIVAPNLLSFTTAPGAGVAITATYSFAFICVFSADTLDLANFSYQLWECQSVKLESYKP